MTKCGSANADDQVTIKQQDDIAENAKQMLVQIPPDGINYLQSYHCFKKSYSKVMDKDKINLTCSKCGLRQLKPKCASKVMATILTIMKERNNVP